MEKYNVLLLYRIILFSDWRAKNGGYGILILVKGMVIRLKDLTAQISVGAFKKGGQNDRGKYRLHDRLCQ